MAKRNGRRVRLSPERRDRFLEILGQTGNRQFAAEAIGVEPRLMDQRRAFDAVLDRQWQAAIEQAHRRLSGSAGPFDCIGGRALNVVRRGRGGRLQLVIGGVKRWSGRTEAHFLAALGTCGNIAAAARAIGFSESSVWQRRSKWPAFAQAIEDVLEEAEVRIEFRLATLASDLGVGDGGQLLSAADERRDANEQPAESTCPQPLDPEFALRFLKWREEKRAGRGKRGRAPAPPSIDEVTARIVRRVEAIKRHRA